MDGIITSEIEISGTVSSKGKICGFVTTSSGGVSPPYTGEYEVTPNVRNDIVLYTRNKLMTENVLVRKISQHEVTNPSGGETLIIGGD
ncbi:MAG: hypothetical protein ACI4JY_10465 [Oscillospiraceae bacterium]